MSETSASAPTDAGDLCRACAGRLRPAFESVVLGDTAVRYDECTSCGSLMLMHPHWLERSYALKLVPDPDFGMLHRTLFVHRTLRRIRAVGMLSKKYRSLDFGSGLGMLVRLQRDEGIDAWGYDRYQTPRFAEQFCKSDRAELPPGQFELITSTEVIEHTTNPVEVLSELGARLAPVGILAVTTELFDAKAHPDPRKWHYLALDHGQHITLLTARGLEHAALAAGLEWVTTVRFQGVPFLHLLVHPGTAPSRLTLLRLALRQLRGEALQSSDRWI